MKSCLSCHPPIYIFLSSSSMISSVNGNREITISSLYRYIHTDIIRVIMTFQALRLNIRYALESLTLSGLSEALNLKLHLKPNCNHIPFSQSFLKNVSPDPCDPPPVFHFLKPLRFAVLQSGIRTASFTFPDSAFTTCMLVW